MTIDLKQITTAQEVFDYVANHLITQGKAAVDSKGTCVYRAKDGSSCAVGCLIPDDEYNKRWEGGGIDTLLSSRVVKGRDFIERMRRHEVLLNDLQFTHDWTLRKEPEYLKNALKAIARNHQLEVNFQ